MAENRGGPRPPDNKPRPPAGPGKYARRTDMAQPAPQPQGQGVYVPSGGQYGTRKPLEQAQAAVPAPALRTPPPQPAARPAGSAAAPMIPSLAQILSRPTDRPGEPPTAGIPSGPGPGPEVLPFDTPFGQGNMTPTLADLERMRKALPGLEALADLPDTSDTFRTYVRTLRGQAGNV